MKICSQLVDVDCPIERPRDCVARDNPYSLELLTASLRRCHASSIYAMPGSPLDHVGRLLCTLGLQTLRERLVEPFMELLLFCEQLAVPERL